jgi:hypothetical protein
VPVGSSLGREHFDQCTGFDKLETAATTTGEMSCQQFLEVFDRACR